MKSYERIENGKRKISKFVENCGHFLLDSMLDQMEIFLKECWGGGDNQK